MAADTDTTTAPVDEAPVTDAPDAPVDEAPAPTPEAPEAPTVDSTPADIEPPVPAVTSQDGALVGDEATTDVDSPVRVSVHADEAPAQVVQARNADPDTVGVHEVTVVTDEVITDPSSPLAVQVPDAGRGSLALPIQRLNQPRPEDVFAASAAEAEGSADGEPDRPTPSA